MSQYLAIANAVKTEIVAFGEPNVYVDIINYSDEEIQKGKLQHPTTGIRVHAWLILRPSAPVTNYISGFATRNHEFDIVHLRAAAPETSGSDGHTSADNIANILMRKNKFADKGVITAGVHLTEKIEVMYASILCHRYTLRAVISEDVSIDTDP
jgi:hypothetical protein